MALPAIFCPRCDTLILKNDQCPICQWQRHNYKNMAGEVVWAVALEAKLPRQGTRPVTAEPFVFISTEQSQIVALDTTEIKAEKIVKWRYSFDTRYRNHSIAVWQEYLLLGNEYIGDFPAPQGELIVLSMRNGEEIWRLSVEGASLSVPLICNNAAYFTVNTGWLYAIDLETRSELWRNKIPAPWSWAPAAPLLTPTNLLVLPSRSDYLVALGTEKTEAIWVFPAGGWFPHTPVWLNGIVYARCWDQHVYALDATNGREVWRSKAPRDYSSDMWVDENFVYIGAKDYQNGADQGARAYALYILARHTGYRAGRFEVKGPIETRPIGNNDAVFFISSNREIEGETQGTIYALDPESQELLWEPYILPQRFQSDLLLLDDLLIAGTRQGAVYAINCCEIDTVIEMPAIYIERGEWENAAIAYALQGDYLEAADLYIQKLNQPFHAGQLYLQAHAYNRVVDLLGGSNVEIERTMAINAAQAIPDTSQRARTLNELGVYRLAAEAFIEAGNLLQAGECYEAAQAWSEARAVYSQANAWDKWDKLTRSLEQWDELIERLLTVGNYAQVAAEYEKRGLFLEAAQYYDRAGFQSEALLAYNQVDPETLTDETWRRLAELAEAENQVDIAIRAYERLREWNKAAYLAEICGQYDQAVNFYQLAGQPLKGAELLTQLARYTESSAIYAQNRRWGRAALNLEQHVDNVIERAGGVRNVKNDAQIVNWLNQIIAWFEEGANLAEDVTKIELYNQKADHCRQKLRQIRGEPLLIWSLHAEEMLIVNEGNTLHYSVENIGWGTAENVTLSIGGSFLHNAQAAYLGSLKRKQKKEGPITILPKITGQVTFQVELSGRSANGTFQEEPFTQTITVSRHRIVTPGKGEVTLKIESAARYGSDPAGLWAEGSDSSPGERETRAISLYELERQQSIESLRRRLKQHHANENMLKEQAAIYGAGTMPLELWNRITLEQNAIAEIEDKLKDLQG